MKEQNLKNRIKLLKAKKEKEYKESILQTQLEFQKIAARTTQLAAEFIELDQQSFVASIKEAQAIPEMQAQLQKDVEMVRQRNEE